MWSSQTATVLLMGACLLAKPATAQNVPGTISGTVTDPEGGTFAGAFVGARNSATAAAAGGVSDAGGKYTLPKLAPGTYELSINMPGMKSFNRTGIVVQPGQTVRIDVRLEDGPSLRTLGEDPAAIFAVFINRPEPPKGRTPRTPDGKPDFSGMWLSGPGPLGSLEMLPWAEALTRARTESYSKDHPAAYCLPSGPIPLMGPGFFKLVHAKTVLMTLHEIDTPGYRQVFLDGRSHPTDFGPTWTGHSIGRWENDALVIDSVGFHDQGWLDFDGHPHTDTLHVTQRLRRPDLGHLEIQITVDDPGAYRKPWTIDKVATLAPDEEIREYICNENNKDAAHMVGK
jgi:Carboxypeptidase regulatory-like domain